MKESNKPTILIILAVVASIFGVTLFPDESGENMLVRERVQVPCPDVYCPGESEIDSLEQLSNALRANIRAMQRQTTSLKREIAKLEAGKETPDAFVNQELRKELVKLKAENKKLAMKNGQLEAKAIFEKSANEGLREEIKQKDQIIAQKEEFAWRLLSKNAPDEYAAGDYEIPEHLIDVKPRRHYIGMRYGYSWAGNNNWYGVGYNYRLTPNSLLGVSVFGTEGFSPMLMANFDVAIK